MSKLNIYRVTFLIGNSMGISRHNFLRASGKLLPFTDEAGTIGGFQEYIT